jgi:hydrogenase/urease accessory protein HupE
MMRLIVALLCWLVPFSAAAHEMRPAFLSLIETGAETGTETGTETGAGRFSVLWKVPALGEQRLGIYASLPANCIPEAEPQAMIVGGAYQQRWIARCEGGLKGGVIGIDGLQATMTDVLLRIQYLDGSTEIARLKPDQPSVTVAGAQTVWQVAWTYFVLGVDHILGGIDHLTFVLALILLIDNRWMLLKTVTAFTVAHSMTLAGAALGLISLPQLPVEAVIALSIAFVARELVLTRQGEPRLSARMPWLVAFAFGLLHGFGFAGALKETGLPQTDVPVALLTFNLGVEAGQLLFVAAVLVVMLGARRLLPAVAQARRLVAYGIGTVAMFWLITRLAAFALVA